MDRRRFGQTSIVALFGGFAGAAGCGDETTQTGTVVQTPPEDLKSMEASAEAYKAMRKPKGSDAKK